MTDSAFAVNPSFYDLSISMLGARRVGKTTFLASTYEKFEKGIFGETKLNFIPDLETMAQLQKRLDKLKTMPDTLTEGIDPTLKGEVNSYIFTLQGLERVFTNRPSIEITFKDYSGETLVDSPKQVVEFINDSLATVIAVDSVALMESKRDQWRMLHDLHNKPKMVTEVLRNSIVKVAQPRLVLFVPIRCEEYLRCDYTGKSLIEMVKSGYEESFQILKNKENISVAILPIQTIGSVYFKDIVSLSSQYKNPTPDDYTFCFQKIASTDIYNPQYTEQPLVYIVKFLLSLITQTRTNNRMNKATDFGFLGILAGMVVEEFMDTDFKETISLFSKKIVREKPFEIVQDLLGYLQ